MNKPITAEGGAQLEGLFNWMEQHRKMLAKEEQHWSVLKDE